MDSIFFNISDTLSNLDPEQLMLRVFSIPEIKDGLIAAIQARLEFEGKTASGKKLKTDSAIEQGEGLARGEKIHF